MLKLADPTRFHPQYRELHGELLARPFPLVSGQVVVSHRAVFFTPEESAAHDAAVAALAEAVGVVAGPEEQGFQLLLVGTAQLRIERHTEFTTFTVFAPQTGAAFSGSAIEQLPEGFLDAIPGRILAAVEIDCELVTASDAGTPKTMERVLEFFGQERLVGGWVIERVALVWSHFQLDERGATRFLVQIHRLTSGRYGRLLQRLVELETYRMAALLGLPLARELMLQLEVLEERHLGVVERIGRMNDADARPVLAELSDLVLAAEHLQARCGSRFRLTEAYARILAARVRELREEQVPGYQTIGEFFDRRLVQSWHTCERAEIALNGLALRLQSTTQLLRARLEVGAQSPPPQLEEKTEPRNFSPLKSRRNLEWLVVVIVTYCLAGLLKMLIEGTRLLGIHLDSSVTVALLLPFLGYGVWRALGRDQDSKE
ncbi:DUF3422 domain-containing protein [bacterium]|nr:DUF3422 domain-containing protein [bacterium]